MTHYRLIAILGMEGAGKGTQATLLGQALDRRVYVTGDTVRHALKTSSAFKRMVSLQSSPYLSDEAVTLLNSLYVMPRDIVDGTPRSEGQAASLDALFGVDAIIHLRLSEKLAKQRLLARIDVNGKKRADDNLRDIEKRIGEYMSREPGILQYYANNNRQRLITVSADQNVEEVHRDIMHGLSALDVQ